MFNPVAPYQYLLPNLYLYMADITNPDLFTLTSQCIELHILEHIEHFVYNNLETTQNKY